MQLSGKFGRVIGWHPTLRLWGWDPLENPGSATGIPHANVRINPIAPVLQGDAEVVPQVYYRHRRDKNNMASRKSREKRRIRDQQIEQVGGRVASSRTECSVS